MWMTKGEGGSPNNHVNPHGGRGGVKHWSMWIFYWPKLMQINVNMRQFGINKSKTNICIELSILWRLWIQKLKKFQYFWNKRGEGCAWKSTWFLREACLNSTFVHTGLRDCCNHLIIKNEIKHEFPSKTPLKNPLKVVKIIRKRAKKVQIWT